MENKYSIVAERARETFTAIRKLRKTLPQYTKAQRDELEKRIKELQAQWWVDVKPYMRRKDGE